MANPNNILTAPAISLKQHLSVHNLDDQHILVLGESEHYLLSGSVYGRLCPLLKDPHSADAMASALRDEFPAVQVYHALSRLEAIGLLAIVTDRALSPDAKAFWYSLGVTSDDISQKLNSTPVAISSTCTSDPSVLLLQTTLEKLGIQVVPEVEATFVIAVTDHYLNPVLEKFAQRMEQADKTWIVAKPWGRILWLGPIIQPATQDYWSCLLHRLRENLAIDHAFQLSFGHLPERSQGSLDITRALAMNLIALEVGKWLVLEQDHCLEKQILTLNTLTLVTEFHPLPQRSQPPKDGAFDHQAGADGIVDHEPLPLLNRPKILNADGGYRTCTPERTLIRLKPFVSPITGIIPDPQRVSTRFPVYLVKQTYPIAEKHRFLQALSREGAAGKGMTDAQAKVSCMAEAIERYSSGFRGNESRIIASYCEVADRAIHPNSLLHFSDSQLEQRQSWNQVHSPHIWIPIGFDQTAPIEWTSCWSLTHQIPRLVPTAYCYLNYFLPHEHQFVVADSNGCAAGNTLEEAVLQGFLELVERDAVALWWFNRVQRPAIAIETFNQPLLIDIREQYYQMNRELVLLDITSDLAIPVVAAISWQEDGKAIRVGLGAHLDAGIAVSRAMTELNQLIVQEEELVSRNQALYQGNIELEQWSKNVRIGEQSYLTPIKNQIKTVDDFPSLANSDLLDDIQTCLDRAIACGIEVLALDLTREDIGFPTVRMIAPKLRHFKPRFAPGRLYDVPVALNWVEHPLPEIDMNPFTFCF